MRLRPNQSPSEATLLDPNKAISNPRFFAVRRSELECSGIGEDFSVHQL
jgi:hypothetical protein